MAAGSKKRARTIRQMPDPTPDYGDYAQDPENDVAVTVEPEIVEAQEEWLSSPYYDPWQDMEYSQPCPCCESRSWDDENYGSWQKHYEARHGLSEGQFSGEVSTDICVIHDDCRENEEVGRACRNLTCTQLRRA